MRCSDSSRSGDFGYAQKEQHIKAQFDLCRCNDNKLISYKISEKAETRISFDGYSEYLLVGKYIGGEYCCVSKGENSFFDVLLIKNGNIEKHIN